MPTRDAPDEPRTPLPCLDIAPEHHRKHAGFLPAAPIHAAQARLREEIKRGDKPPGSTLSAYFVTATDPEHRYPGVVRRIASKAETVEGKHVVKLTVGFSDQVRNDYLKRNRELRPGSEVRARVQCGHARLAYVMLRDVVHVFYETILFRWPFLT